MRGDIVGGGFATDRLPTWPCAEDAVRKRSLGNSNHAGATKMPIYGIGKKLDSEIAERYPAPEERKTVTGDISAQ